MQKIKPSKLRELIKEEILKKQKRDLLEVERKQILEQLQEIAPETDVMAQGFRVVDFIVGGNPELGWEISNKFKLDQFVTLSEDMKSAQILNILKKEGVIDDTEDINNITIEGDFKSGLRFKDKTTRKPLFELIPESAPVSKKMTDIEKLKGWLDGTIDLAIVTTSTKNYRPGKFGSKITIRKVFNEGRGLLDFITKKDNEIIVNSILLNKSEKVLLAQYPNVRYVELGYPDYYSKGLEEL